MSAKKQKVNTEKTIENGTERTVYLGAQRKPKQAAVLLLKNG
jgi:hypothetical protein